MCIKELCGTVPVFNVERGLYTYTRLGMNVHETTAPPQTFVVDRSKAVVFLQLVFVSSLCPILFEDMLWCHVISCYLPLLSAFFSLSAIFINGTTFVTSRLLSSAPISFWKWATPKENNLLLPFLEWVFWEGSKKLTKLPAEKMYQCPSRFPFCSLCFRLVSTVTGLISL